MTARRARPAPVPAEDTLLTAAEVMQMLKVGRTFLSDHSAELRAVKIGRLWRCKRSDLLAFIERQRPKPEPVTADPTPIRPDIDVSDLPDVSPVTGRRWSWSTKP